MSREAEALQLLEELLNNQDMQSVEPSIYERQLWERARLLLLRRDGEKAGTTGRMCFACRRIFPFDHCGHNRSEEKWYCGRECYGNWK